MSEEWFDSARLEACDQCHGEGKVRARDPHEVAEERRAHDRRIALRGATLFGLGGVVAAVLQWLMLNVVIAMDFGFERATSCLFFALVAFAGVVFWLYGEVRS